MLHSNSSSLSLLHPKIAPLKVSAPPPGGRLQEHLKKELRETRPHNAVWKAAWFRGRIDPFPRQAWGRDRETTPRPRTNRITGPFAPRAKKETRETRPQIANAASFRAGNEAAPREAWRGDRETTPRPRTSRISLDAAKISTNRREKARRC